MEACVGAPRLLQPKYRLIDLSSKQMHGADSEVPTAEVPIARIEANCPLLVGDHVVNRPGRELACPKIGVSGCEVVVEGDGPLVFRNGLLVARLRSSHLALGEMRPGVVGPHR